MEEVKEPSKDVDSETKTPETVTPETTTQETTTPNEEENSNGNNTNKNNPSPNNSSSVDKTGSSTKTGDNNNINLFFKMSLISMLGLAIVAPKKKERGKEKDKKEETKKDFSLIISFYNFIIWNICNSCY